MKVIKRNGTSEDVDFNKITNRIKKICNEANITTIDPVTIAQKVCASLHDNVSTSTLDDLTATICISMNTVHPDYGTLASCISVSNLHKQLKHLSFKEKTEILFGNKKVNERYYKFVKENIDAIENEINYEKDYLFDFFGFKTLEKSYLYKVNKKIIEQPQDMFMRVSCAMHIGNIEKALETYKYMSEKYFIHATPTLFNAGSNREQLASCFLMTIGDSIESIYENLYKCAKISKLAGGIGIDISSIRSKGSSINGTPNIGSGIVPMMKVFNETAKYVNQEGKRPGSFAMYLSVDHPDIFYFLDMKKNTGDEDERARDLFYAVYISDLFMKRVEADEQWSLFDPYDCPDLYDSYGEEYEKRYIEYETQNKAKKVVNAQDVWKSILVSQIETGTPYMLYKDSINNKSNQKNLGTIKSSNLCCEIVEYTNSEEIAVCNLASICLPRFIEDGQINHEQLHKIAEVVTINLNNVIDINHYPVQETKKSNMRHRPIGIGVQGLADVYALLKIDFDSEEASKVNKEIFETLYHGAMTASLELAKLNGQYSTFDGSPLSQGKFQFDLWNTPVDFHSGRYDWDHLRQQIVEHGVRNSLLIAPMPTASTSQIMGNNECFEPFTSNIYVRRTIAGEFTVVNKHLVRDLIELDLWNEKLKNKIIMNNGSIQSIDEIPDKIKKLYRTVWELKQKALIDQSADRGKYICQTQSLNLYIANPSYKQLTSMHFYSWKKGLKTGLYYLHTKPASNTVQVSICESCSG